MCVFVCVCLCVLDTACEAAALLAFVLRTPYNHAPVYTVSLYLKPQRYLCECV